MQDTTFGLVAQKQPSLALFEQSIRVRLEAFTLNAPTSLEHLQNQDREALTNYLELTMIELGFLLNELRLLEQCTH